MYNFIKLVPKLLKGSSNYCAEYVIMPKIEGWIAIYNTVREWTIGQLFWRHHYIPFTTTIEAPLQIPIFQYKYPLSLSVSMFLFSLYNF